MKPRIGISVNYRVDDDGDAQIYLDEDYYLMVEEAGATPIPIPLTENVLQLDARIAQIDGVLLTGGRDLNPALWHEPLHPAATLIHPRRQRFEFMLYDQARKCRLPVLGICLGIQVINVAHGGSLHQHLPDAPLPQKVIHQSNPGPAGHPIALSPKSRLRQWLQADQVTVNSYHHQAINRVGAGLLVGAMAADGVVEAVEQPDYPFLLGVQWHPERRRNNPVTAALMDRFLAAAEKYRTEKQT